MNNTPVIIWRIFFVGVIIVYIGAILNYHIPLNGITRATTFFDTPSGIVSMPYPVSRMRDIQRFEGMTYRTMTEDPLYIDIKTFVPYKKAAIELTYKNTTDIPLKIGLKKADGTIERKDFEQVYQDGSWLKGRVSFDLARASYYNTKYTMLFSAPGLVTEKNIPGEVRLSKMQLSLNREPLW